MRRWRRDEPVVAALLLLVALTWGSGAAGARPLEIHATQVTAADVALSPDGERVVFTLLGHLFGMAATGGPAEQLTFGSCYDGDPVFSPDGKLVAFTSDRDGSESNVFVLGLEDRRLQQLTHEERATRPAWSPDGKWIAYLRHERAPSFSEPTVVVRVPAAGGQGEPVSGDPRGIGALFYLPDGRLAWSVLGRDEGPAGNQVSRIEAAPPAGAAGPAATLRTLGGAVDRALAAPAGDGYYVHRTTGNYWVSETEELLFVPLAAGAERRIIPSAARGRYAITPDGKSLLLGDEGRLWRVELPAGAREAVPFRATAKLEIADAGKPSRPAARAGTGPRAILSPRLSPDGRGLAFCAAGFLWWQPMGGGPARRIGTGEAFEGEPAFSPDGRQLAYVQSEGGTDSLVVLGTSTFENLGGSGPAGPATDSRADGPRKRLASVTGLGAGAGISELSWSSDSRRLVASVSSGFTSEIVAFDIADGGRQHLADVGFWSPRPQLAAGGEALYFSADTSGTGNLYRLALRKDAQPEAITRLTHHLSEGQVTPDGRLLVFRRNRAILAAPLGRTPVTDAEVREVSKEGGNTFALTPDGSAIVYAVGAQVWRQPLSGGPRQEVPIRLALPRMKPSPPLLVRGARVLGAGSDAFSPPTSILLEGGRIRWIGDERTHELPRDAEVIEAAGRFAIPGLFEMHVHAAGAEERVFLAYGITSLRDTGGPLPVLGTMADRSELVGAAMPRYFYSGEILEGRHPVWGDGFLQIEDEREARATVEQLAREGAAFIKVYPSLPWSLKRVVADAARRAGLPVVGHGMSQEEIVKSVSLGFLSLEHEISAGRAFDDILALLAAANTRWDPTVAVGGGDALLLREDPERLAEPKFAALTPAAYLHFARFAAYNQGVATDALRGRVAAHLAAIGRGHRLGVTLLVGTDAPNPEVFYGSSLHWEMARLVEAGLSPAEVLRLATSGAADAVGAADLGVLAPGKAADVVLLAANPLEEIGNTQSIWRVIKDGKLYDPAALQAASARAAAANPPGGS